jgi:hypothetical protein
MSVTGSRHLRVIEMSPQCGQATVGHVWGSYNGHGGGGRAPSSCSGPHTEERPMDEREQRERREEREK